MINKDDVFEDALDGVTKPQVFDKWVNTYKISVVQSTHFCY